MYLQPAIRVYISGPRVKVVRPSYVYYMNSYTGKTASL